MFQQVNMDGCLNCKQRHKWYQIFKLEITFTKINFQVESSWFVFFLHFDRFQYEG